ncbi:zinc finger MYND domain-containing protein [Phanerochaete sordida]|uniref:Zinc finger MYND domain-containing protein n=1 Tax=Phanerochaete sordida TaxID=48140 RepID=A0A9P3LFY8_9APHY|nr:zinc finger MYND domain-containing protein [Phanerochaete sordida]
MPCVRIFSGDSRPEAFFALRPRQMPAAILQHHMEAWSADQRIMAWQSLRDCITGMSLGKTADDAAWEVLLDAGLAYAIKYVLSHSFFCGFSEEELVACNSNSPQDVEEYIADVLPYVALVICNLRDYLEFSLTYCSKEENNPRVRRKRLKSAEVVLRELPRMWQNLWQIRTPFLDSQPPGIGVDFPSMKASPRMIHHGLSEVSAIMSAFHDKYPKILTAPTSTKMPHVVFTIWVYCYHKIDRTRVAENAYVALVVYQAAHYDVQYRHDEFVNEFIVGLTNPKQIARAALRDLRARGDSAHLIISTIFALLSLFRPLVQSEVYPMTLPYQRRLLHSCLSACQSVLCMGEDSTFSSCESFMDTAFSMLQMAFKSPGNYPGLFPERRIHAVIALASTFLLEAIDSWATKFVAEVRGVAQIFCDQLRRHAAAHDPASPSDPQIDLLRRASRAHWKHVMDGLRARRVHRGDGDTRWRPLHQTWVLLGRALEVDAYGTAPVEHEEVRATFPLLTRCTWRECLCSVHEPLHKLQACRGCSLAAYCNDHCQRKDWTDGGHSKDCAKRPSKGF